MKNKIFKTILVLTICLGLSISTNAAVSVSDGSAFVTKAEFSADLNNLSNRMAQLENALDAKIDSLVSSYLTRNGIWNGAKQECNTCSHDSIVPKAMAASGGSVDSDLVSGTYIPSINKSGMLVFSFGYRNKTGNNSQNTHWGYYGATTNWASDNGFIVTYNFYENGSLSYSGVLLSAIGFTGTGGLMIMASLTNSWVNGNAVFFVQKGSTITYNLHQLAHTSGPTSLTALNTQQDAMLWFRLNTDASVY